MTCWGVTLAFDSDLNNPQRVREGGGNGNRQLVSFFFFFPSGILNTNYVFVFYMSYRCIEGLAGGYEEE